MSCSSSHPRLSVGPVRNTGRRMFGGSNLWLGAAGTGFLLVLNGCAHDVQDPEPVAPTVQLRLSVEFRFNNHGYELASTYNDTLGHLFKLDTLCFIVSGIRAENEEEDVIGSYADVIPVANAAQANNNFELGALTADHLHQ